MPAGQMSNISDKELPESTKYHNFGNMISARIGKRAAGHMLDGKEWLEFPRV